MKPQKFDREADLEKLRKGDFFQQLGFAFGIPHSKEELDHRFSVMKEWFYDGEKVPKTNLMDKVNSLIQHNDKNRMSF